MPADSPVGWADRSGDSDARRLPTKSVKKQTTNVMAELDLSLSDALTDAPQTGQVENLVERDFVAQLEAETFDDQVGETVGKTDYIPLLDDDTRADTGSALENGEQEAHGVQKPED